MLPFSWALSLLGFPCSSTFVTRLATTSRPCQGVDPNRAGVVVVTQPFSGAVPRRVSLAAMSALQSARIPGCLRVVHTSGTVTGGGTCTCAVMGVMPPLTLIIKAVMASAILRTMRADRVIPSLVRIRSMARMGYPGT